MSDYEKGTLFTLRETAILWASNDLSTDDEVGFLSTGDVVVPLVTVPKLGLIKVLSRLGVGWLSWSRLAQPWHESSPDKVKLSNE